MTAFRPGDRVTAVDAYPHRHWLRLGQTYTVDQVSEDGRYIGLSTGPATMWDADQFVAVEPARAEA
jgi:hypothetical protein